MSDYLRGVLILVVAAGTIGGALAFQAAGYAPCELCLLQRWPYYVGAPLAAIVTFLVANAAPRTVRLMGFSLLALLFAGSAIFGVYHAGVEWGFWPGPSSCTGNPVAPGSMVDFRRQIETIHVVRCDAVALRILGLSLAGWNAVMSAGLAMLALGGILRRDPATLVARAAR